MKIEIKDDFDLDKIMVSGQCFRMKKLDENGTEPVFLSISNDNILLISQIDKTTYLSSCTENEWKKIWSTYFDLSRNYQKIRDVSKGEHKFVDECMDYGRGLRILKQDPWEMLITFIISQRKSMPAIATSVEKLCKSFGDKVSLKSVATSFNGKVERNKDLPDFIWAFPTPEQLCKASMLDIQKCGVGYRAEYIKEAAQAVQSGSLDLQACNKLDDESLFEELCKVKGIGKKVANCIMLFGFGRVSRAPIDVWIERVIKEDFGGKNPFDDFADVAGIIQQYLFFFKTQTK